MKITSAIAGEARKLVCRHQRYASDLEEQLRRTERRSLNKPTKTLLLPQYWNVDAGFNPYHVRSSALSIGHSIERALARRVYQPRAAVAYTVPKDGGARRPISVFQVADNAVSRLVYKAILAKNSSRLSAHCYAYRTDLTIQDAVLDIASDFKGKKRLFVAEFDFSKFFDSIAHSHIETILKDRRFFLTDLELHVIRGFLRAPTLAADQYQPVSSTLRERGIPQGTSVSLFLANIAAQPLDDRLERLGVGFVRFADDTLIWADDYSLICRATTALEDTARDMGVDINLSKSAGISILAPDGAPAEFKAKNSVEFLGYKISSECVSIRDRNVQEIKKWISYLIYSNLLLEPKRGNVVAARVAPSVDRDFVVLIFQLRRYLYGDLSEKQLRRYLAQETPRIRYRGLMSFYPIIDDDELLHGLDGWLLNTIFLTLRVRRRLFEAKGIVALPTPHGLSKRDLLSFVGATSGKATLDLRLPSFARMGKLLRNASKMYGANAIANPLIAYGPAAAQRRQGYVRPI
jgi:RNA-directed DNA polymerase